MKLLENSPNVTMTETEHTRRLARRLGDFTVSSRPQIITKIHNNNIFEIDISPTAGYRKDFDNTFSNVTNIFQVYEKHDSLYPVSTTGLVISGEETVGSTRFCNNSEELADTLEKIIKASNCFPLYNKDGEEYVGVSPYFRFMRYKSGGEHFPHYDANYQYIADPSLVTRYTMVVYFTNNQSGEIVFINDTNYRNEKGNDGSSVFDFDWDRQATDDEIYLKIKPRLMKIVLFPHELCHSVLPLEENNRIICRGDLVFRKQNSDKVMDSYAN